MKRRALKRPRNPLALALHNRGHAVQGGKEYQRRPRMPQEEDYVIAEKPFINLTPELSDTGYQLYGEAVAREAFARIARDQPDIDAMLKAERAFVLNIYGPDLGNIPEVLAKYREGGVAMRFGMVWQHHDAGAVATYVCEIPKGSNLRQVMAEKLGWGSA
jgi:hypothetical protein